MQFSWYGHNIVEKGCSESKQIKWDTLGPVPLEFLNVKQDTGTNGTEFVTLLTVPQYWWYTGIVLLPTEHEQYYVGSHILLKWFI